MLAFTNVELVLRDHYLPKAYLLTENDTIKDFGPMKQFVCPEGAEVIDGGGLYLAPGMFDTHTHACEGVRYAYDAVTPAAAALKHGATSVLATTSVKHTFDVMLEAIARIRTAMHDGTAPNIVGINMEGPYMNDKYGSPLGAHYWTNSLKPEIYDKVIEACGGDVCIWTVAPELEGIEGFVAAAHAANPRAKFAVGHSEASPAQIEKLIPYGLCIGTHHTNATGDLVKYPECRGVCVDETVNYHSEFWAEIISDSLGVHVDPYNQRLIRKIKGDERIILITDATDSKGAPLPGLEDVTDINFTNVGDVSGSKLTMDAAVRNWMTHTGASLVEAFRLAAYNPAMETGFTDRGEIAVGKRADLLLIDHHVNIKAVYLGGEKVD